MRTDSTINSEIIMKLNKNDAVLVTRESYDWYKIALPKQAACYIFSKFISAMDEKTGVVTSENVNVRLNPNTKSAILGKLKKGQSVNLINFANNWYVIEPTQECYGWIHKTAVKTLDSAETAIPLPEKDKIQNTLNLEGVIYERGITSDLFRKRITHKLATVDGEVYLLTGNKYKFNMYANRKVRIKGYLIKDLPNQEYPVIEVQELEKLN